MKIKDIIKAIVLSVAMTGCIYFFDEKSIFGMMVAAIISITLIVNMALGLTAKVSKEEPKLQHKNLY